MNNIKTTIQIHNRKYLKANNHEDDKKLCNCRIKTKCLLNNNCLIENVIYKVTINSTNGTRNYLGSTGGTFKKNDDITTSKVSINIKKTKRNCQVYMVSQK